MKKFDKVCTYAVLGLLIIASAVTYIVSYRSTLVDLYMPPLENFPPPRTNAPVMEVTTHAQSRALTQASRFFRAKTTSMVV